MNDFSNRESRVVALDDYVRTTVLRMAVACTPNSFKDNFKTGQTVI
jgi:hypothetical protein